MGLFNATIGWDLLGHYTFYINISVEFILQEIILEKYGFVYIWFDRKHKRYYIGAHWGNENDSYICSSNWMRDAYKRRPHDFKRRTLTRIYTTRKDTFIKEQEWLELIKPEEIGKRYYNLQIIARNNWEDDPNKNLSRKEKMKKNHWRKNPDNKEALENYTKGIKNRKCRNKEPEVIEKTRNSMIETMAEKFHVRKYTYKKNSQEHLKLVSDGVKRAWINKTEEEKLERNRKIGEGQLGRTSPMKGKVMSEEHKRKIGEANKEIARKKRLNNKDITQEIKI